MKQGSLSLYIHHYYMHAWRKSHREWWGCMVDRRMSWLAALHSTNPMMICMWFRPSRSWFPTPYLVNQKMINDNQPQGSGEWLCYQSWILLFQSAGASFRWIVFVFPKERQTAIGFQFCHHLSLFPILLTISNSGNSHSCFCLVVAVLC